MTELANNVKIFTKFIDIVLFCCFEINFGGGGHSFCPLFLLNKGFPNTDKWELSFDFKHDNIQYTGIILLMDASVNIKDATEIQKKIAGFI